MARKFDIIKKKNLPDEAKIVGFSFLKEPTDNDKKDEKFDFYEFSNQNEIGCKLPKRKPLLHTQRVMLKWTAKKTLSLRSRADC